MPNKEDSVISPSTVKRDENQRIVQSVLTEGLLSARQQFLKDKPLFTSANGDATNEVTLCAFVHGRMLSKEDAGFGGVEKVLYRDAYFSLLPVVAERQTDTSDKVRSLSAEQLEDRIAQSMVVVLPLDHTMDHSDSDETLIPGPVPTGKFKTVFVPGHVKEELELPEEVAGVPIKQVGVINRNVSASRGKVFSAAVPDYEGGISELLEESDKPLVVHAIRLLTEEDAERLVSSNQE